jgi:glycosyltransferase involved in cell wall biosynthesis
MRDDSSLNPQALDERILQLQDDLARATAAVQRLTAQLADQEQRAAESDKELQSLRLLAANRQREVRLLTMQLHRYEDRLRHVRARLREERSMPRGPLEESEGDLYTSRIWRLASAYYRLVNETPLRYPYDFLKMWQKYGLRYSLRVAARELARQRIAPGRHATDATTTDRALVALVQRLNEGKYRGVCVVASTFAFDETLNQRAIKLSWFLAASGLGVIYIAWRWSRHELTIPVGQEVSEGIFQMPIDVFLEHVDAFRSLDYEHKSLIIHFPYPRLLAAALALKQYGFRTIYEILDNWEEFHRVNQAPWYAKDAEQAMVLNSDLVTTVSEPLKRKFSLLRADLELVPNGYDSQTLGAQNRNIALPFSKQNELNIGYFGHLTDSWFDWDLLLEISDLALHEHLPLKFHIIGYGEPRYIRNRISARQDRIVFHGRVPTSELYQHVADWDAGIIPFRPGRLSESVDPIKVYEYLYFGLPVMVSGIPHLEGVPHVQCFEGASGFLRTLESMRRQPRPETAREVDNFLQFSTWGQRFSRLWELVQDRPRWKCL